MRTYMAGGGDEDGGSVALRRLTLQPALREVAIAVGSFGLQVRGLADALGGGEADGDGGVAAEDVQVSLVLGEVTVGRQGDPMKDGRVVIRPDERADGAEEG